MNRYISASEIGEYAYCSRAWWLVHVCDLPRTGGLQERNAGVLRHQQHGVVVCAARFVWRAGLAMLVLAVIALGYALLTR